MPAYLISEVDVHDAAGFEAYRTIAAKAIAQYGGRYLVRGGHRGRPAAEEHHRRRVSLDGSLAPMVCIAGIRRSAQIPLDRTGSPVDLHRGRAGRLSAFAHPNNTTTPPARS